MKLANMAGKTKQKYIHIPQTKTARQGRGSFLASMIVPLDFRIAGRQVSKPRCLSPAAHSLDFMIAGRQVPKPKCLSPAAHSSDFRIAGRRVPKPRCLRPAAHSLDFSTKMDMPFRRKVSFC